MHTIMIAERQRGREVLTACTDRLTLYKPLELNNVL